MTNSLDTHQSCHNCGSYFAPSSLACDKCHALVHSEDLARISLYAKSLEEKNDFLKAREEWSKAIPLLPPGANQMEWIRSKIAKLDLQISTVPQEPPKREWVRKLGPLGPIAILLAKSKTLLLAIFKLKFLLSLFAFAAVYWSLYGARFGIGFAVLILVHELGHYIDIRRRGLPAEMPVFLPGLGAYVRWEAMGVKRTTRAAISLAGPLAGLLGAAVCLYIWHLTGNGLWAALARSSAWLNVLNLIPVWVLDGGQATSALQKLDRWILLGLCMLLWVGLGEGLFFLVAVGFVYRLFTKDLPPLSFPPITVYYAAVLIGLAAILFFSPNKGFAAH
jgi:Zn-dependent protease